MLARSRVAVLAILTLSACASTLTRVPWHAPAARDPDLRPWGPPPGPRTDGAPRDDCYLPFEPREAIDVDALDEVPDSSWYTNRAPSSAEAARGACGEMPDLAGTWTVLGVGDGGLELAIGGGRFLLAPDEPGRPERATAAEAIASRLYHAAGYRVPCTRIVYFSPSALRRQPSAPPSLDRAIVTVLRHAVAGPAGTVRAALRELPSGRDLGPFSWAGTRADDPNDRVPHEHRRALRASALLAVLADQQDTGVAGTRDVWQPTSEGLGFVEHYLVGFRHAMGGARPLGPGLSWPDDVPRTVPNPAMDALTERDAHWMARKLAVLGASHLRAMVREGRLSDPRDAKELTRALRLRRRALLERYLLTWTPVGHPRAVGRELCFDDLATMSGLTTPVLRPMVHRVTLNGRRLRIRADGRGTVCAPLPGGPAAVLAVTIAGRPSDEARLLPPVTVLTRRWATGGFLVVGVER